MLRVSLLVSVFVTCVGNNARAADDWPQFRGPDGDGHSGAVDVPLAWSEEDGVVWKTPIEGRGWSSPVVLGDQVWLTTAIETPASPDEIKKRVRKLGMFVPSPHLAGKVTLKVICIERASGRLVHDVTLFEVDDPPVICLVNSYASPTPVGEPGRLYCDFGTMGTVALDTKTGRVLWTRHLPIEHQVGPGSSPILYRDTLILVRDGCDRQYIAALDKNTGQTVWKTDRPPITTPYLPYRKAFSTPLVAAVDGGEQMIIPGARWMVSYNPAGGKELWRVDTGNTFSNAARPVLGHGMVYICTAYGGTRLLAVRVDGRGDVTATHVAWELKKQTPKRSSPLLVGDELYFVSDVGVANCVDARTGKIHWSERLSGAFSASPVYAGGHIFLFGENGTTTIVRPGKEFVTVAENSVEGRIMASPAVLDRSIFLRTDSHLYRIGARLSGRP
jgi:outer membrane protein assembly factor BamB